MNVLGASIGAMVVKLKGYLQQIDLSYLETRFSRPAVSKRERT